MIITATTIRLRAARCWANGLKSAGAGDEVDISGVMNTR